MQKEVDISREVSNVAKYGMVALLVVAVLAAVVAWFIFGRQKTLTLYEAKVSGAYIAVRSRTAGTIEKIFINDGDAVKSGQPLATVRVKVTEEELAELEKNVRVMEENLATLNQGIPAKRPVVSGAAKEADLEKIRHLYEVGAISAAEYEKAKNDLAKEGEVRYLTVIEPASETSITQAKQRLRQAQAALTAAQGQLAATEILSPVKGTVVGFGIAVGTDVRPGQPIFAVGDVDRLVLIASLPKDKAEHLTVGLAAKYKLGNQNFTGTIVAVEPMPIKSDETAEPKGTAAKADAAKKDETPATDKEAAKAKKTISNDIWRAVISIPHIDGFWPKPGMTTTVNISL